MLVSPSPRELFNRLTDDEKVAVDRIIELGVRSPVDDAKVTALAPDPKRRLYLRAVAVQLVGLGVTVQEDERFDEAYRSHTEYAQKLVEERVAYEAAHAERLAAERGVAERDRKMLETMPAAVRKAILRHRRRRAQLRPIRNLGVP